MSAFHNTSYINTFVLFKVSFVDGLCGIIGLYTKVLQLTLSVEAADINCFASLCDNSHNVSKESWYPIGTFGISTIFISSDDTFCNFMAFKAGFALEAFWQVTIPIVCANSFPVTVLSL